MQCPSCRQDNPVRARFCAACGTRLPVSCAACGAALPAGARFCPDCGRAVGEATPPATAVAARAPDVYTPRHLAEQILTSRAALQGERKPVTVLFCDLVGSTGLAERLGADAMHDLLNRFFEAALAEIHRYEGTVNQFLGDGFMALFGAPIAHEDHARRAALAALGVARALGRPLLLDTGAQVTLGVRMGLNTGFVVVGAIGDNLRMDYTAVGDCTHLAARLQQAAAPGTILVSAATARLIEDHVPVELVGALEVRGLSSPITAFRLTGAAATSQRERWARRSGSHFVGREREVATLRELLADAANAQGRIAGVVGEPGVGKSRLLLEVRDEAGAEVTWLEGRCLSYGSTIPYLPVLDLLRGTCEIADADPPERAADKVRARLDSLGLDPAERAPYLLQLLGLKEPDDAARALGGDVLVARTLDTLRQLWLRSSRQRPLVLVVEDLHWIDPASESCLAALAKALGGASLLLVTTYRPGYRPSWIDRSYATQIALAPLRRDDSLRVVHSLLPTLAAHDPRARLILDKAEGNPFFLEELVHAVGDAADGPLRVPDSVQGVLAARIDRLPETAKHVVQTAAVLGREFPERLLRAIADAPERLDADLHELTRQEFLYERSGAEEPSYVFKHTLTQDVAHATLVTPRRRALHRRAADALMALYPDRVADLAPRLAHHYLEAESWPEAAEHARRAAEMAERAWANTEARARYDQALRAAERAGRPAAERRELLQARAGVSVVLGHFDPARADLEAALALAEGEGDAVAQGRVLTALGGLWGGHRDYAQALELSRRAIALLEPAGDRRALADARAQLGIMLLNVVRMTESRREFEVALGLFEALDDVAGQGRILEMLGMNRWLAGDVATSFGFLESALVKLRAVSDRRAEIATLVSLSAAHARREGYRVAGPYLDEALAIARSLEAPADEAFVRCATADFGLVFGRHAVALSEASAALAIARELGHLEWTAYALRTIGRVHAECGDPAQARAIHDEELEIARRLGASIWIADALGNLGHDLLLAGELTPARSLLEEAIATGGECGEKVVHPLLGLGELALRSGRPDEALAAVERFRVIGRDQRVIGPEAARIEAAAWSALGRHEEAATALADVVRAAEAVGTRPTRWRAGLDLAETLRALGRSDASRQAAAEVQALLEVFAAELPAPLAATFRQSPLARRAGALAASAATA
jgi:class 3 adenylate cyclase/tetratricopeptide (TPR) repeat protein